MEYIRSPYCGCLWEINNQLPVAAVWHVGAGGYGARPRRGPAVVEGCVESGVATLALSAAAFPGRS